MPREPDIFIPLVAWIEERLDEPLTLELIAQRAGFSAYHFSRMFTARMGRSVMAHVRGRRLVRGARRLCTEPDVKLVDLALDCGFESQEAFTRAFKRLFGVSPGRFRVGFSPTPIEGQFPMNAPSSTSTAVTRLPELIKLEAFRVAGPSRRFDDATRSEIPQLWSALVGALPLKGQSPSWATYGVVWSTDREAGSFMYMAGVGVVTDGELPKGFTVKGIPAATYVVFRIALNGSALHPQVKSAMATIWGELIPASGLRVVDSPDFEMYDGHFAPDQPGAVIDFYVPVEA
ncbi:AraC family transcriptional regulator [Variovorax paradoxus]|uniref:AraC family transcriptional regulator n=1 Tax=Variovorax paradoxus TaxID=34073 RepID=UPI0021ABE771|nr:AraC family transcriptional regulator [Variovorax paradoxus]UVH59878.1 AraC family transcriptional regulator [Variovorax paradoxus]